MGVLLIVKRVVLPQDSIKVGLRHRLVCCRQPRAGNGAFQVAVRQSPANCQTIINSGFHLQCLDVVAPTDFQVNRFRSSFRVLLPGTRRCPATHADNAGFLCRSFRSAQPKFGVVVRGHPKHVVPCLRWVDIAFNTAQQDARAN